MTNPTGDALLARIKELEEALRIIDKYVSSSNEISRVKIKSLAQKALNGNHS